MGFLKSLAGSALDWIDEDRVRMASESESDAIELFLGASDATFLDLVSAFVRMCNKGKSPRGYFVNEMLDNFVKRPRKIQLEAVNILKNIEKGTKYSDLANNLWVMPKTKETLTVQTQKNYQDEYRQKAMKMPIKDLRNAFKTLDSNGSNKDKRNVYLQVLTERYRAEAQEMPTARLEEILAKLSSTETEKLKEDIYKQEKELRTKYRKEGELLSIDELKAECEYRKSRCRKIVYQEIIKEREAQEKRIAISEKDGQDIFEQIKKLKELWKCGAITEKEYENKKEELLKKI